MKNDAMTQQILVRLDRFEVRLDEVAQAITQMVRTEERVSQIIEQNTALFDTVAKLQDDVTNLKMESVRQKQSISAFERFAWIVIGASASVVAWFFRGE